MGAEDDLRLAWRADRDGRAGTRDVLLTLAVLGAGPGDRWARLGFERLVAARPDHWLARAPGLEAARGDGRIAAAAARLRATFPEARVAMLRLRADALAGPCSGRRPAPLELIVDDLLGPDSGLVADALRRRPSRPRQILAGPPPGTAPDPLALGPLVALYVSVVLAIRGAAGRGGVPTLDSAVRARSA